MLILDGVEKYCCVVGRTTELNGVISAKAYQWTLTD